MEGSSVQLLLEETQSRVNNEECGKSLETCGETIARKCMSIHPRSRLFNVKMHYLFRTMGVAPLNIFMSLIMRQRGMSPESVGLVSSSLHAFSVITGTSFVTLADHLKKHQIFFFTSLCVTPVAMSAIYWTPHVLHKDIDGVDNMPAPIAEAKKDAVTEVLKAAEVPFSQLTTLPLFWFIVVNMLLIQISSFVSSNLTDSVCYAVLGKDGHLYGQQRLFGTIGWGYCALMTGILVDLYSANLKQDDYFPAFMLVVIFSTFDLFFVLRMEIPTPEVKKNITVKEFMSITLAPRNIIFFVTSIILGASITMHGTFHSLYVEDVAKKWDPDFPALRTLQGLIIAIQCFLGEIPVFTFAGDIILKIGIVWSFVVVLFTHSLRYFLYYIITNPWIILPIEVIHGIYFGLCRTALTYYASMIAPPGKNATMLAVLKISQVIGRSLAGITGGLLWSKFGGHGLYLIAGIFLVFYNIIYITLSFLRIKEGTCTQEKVEVVDLKTV
ncbi:putative transporter YwbF [Oratosquilla oratoria]|uniref:putative transporter YwbF n=1 Tax=Oratosquilla oratoria TaxID=337810 RepID=UPI003F764BAC